MSNNQLSGLENKAKEALGGPDGKMTGFTDGANANKICCPWLHWYSKRFPDNLFERKWNGVLIMQDWGPVDKNGEPETLEDAIKYIEDAKNANEMTMRNLYNSEWRCLIWGENPTWLVTNAVWGLRKTSDKCGYLGDTIHARAFSIWAEILALVMANKTNPPLKVVFAGSWARFGDQSENSDNLKVFLGNWKKWSDKKKAGDSVGINEEATAHFYPHPSIWKKRNPWDGPPACNCID